MPCANLERELAGAATGAENFGNFTAACMLESSKRKFLAQIAGDRNRLLDNWYSDPARIGIFFILVLDQARDRILDGSQSWNGGAQLRLLLRLAHLLHENGGDRLGPCPVQQPGGAGKRMKRKIGRHRQQPQRRNRRSGFKRRGQRIAQLARPVNFLLTMEKHIFIDETLARQSGVKSDAPVLRVIARCRFEQHAPRHGEKAFQFDVGVLRRNQQRQEQFVVRQCCRASRTEQFRRRQGPWPGLGGPRRCRRRYSRPA